MNAPQEAQNRGQDTHATAEKNLKKKHEHVYSIIQEVPWRERLPVIPVHSLRMWSTKSLQSCFELNANISILTC